MTQDQQTSMNEMIRTLAHKNDLAELLAGKREENGDPPADADDRNGDMQSLNERIDAIEKGLMAALTALSAE